MKKAFLYLCVLLIAAFTQATVIDADWKTSGDGLTILDVTNNLEWLDLTETVNLTMDYVSGQLGEGGEFEGWHFATANEVQNLLVSAGAVVASDYHVDNVAPVEYLFDIWGELGVGDTYGTRTSRFKYIPNGNWVAGAISIGNSLWHPGEGYASDYGIYADPNSYAYVSDSLTANALVRKASAVVQLDSLSDFSNNSTIINFDDGYHLQAANTLYLNQGVEFSRDDGYSVVINDYDRLSWKTTITPPNTLATIGADIIGYPAPIWTTHLNANFVVPVNQVGAYFGNSEGFDEMILSAYGENDILLGSVTVDSNRNGDVNQFIGLSSDEPIYSLRFENDGTSYAVVIDDFIFNPIHKPAALPISVDIKPQSCPNPVNVKSKGVLPVAILGSEEFDVMSIDPNTIRLEGVAFLRSSYEDVSTPAIDETDCACTTDGPDGYMDLTLKFDRQELLAVLGEVEDGEEWLLHLTGSLYDGTEIEGTDCILIKKKGKK